MSAWESPILRVTSGQLNNVNDTVIGGQPALGGLSKYAGQLGKTLWVDPSQIGAMYNSSIGTLYGGRFRYVRFRAADAGDYVPGQIVFWDTTVDDWTSAYQVTENETLSSALGAMMIGGIFLGGTEPGNYGIIQDLGIVPVQFASALTGTPGIGVPTYAAAMGAGANEGFADVLAGANPTDFSDIGLLQSRFLGNAVTLPANNSLTNVILRFQNVLG